MKKKKHRTGGASWGRPVARGAAAFWWLMLAMTAPAFAESCFERLESAQKPTWETIQQSFRKRGVTIAFPTRQDCEDPARCQMTVGTNETGPLFSVDLSRDKDGVECELKAGRYSVSKDYGRRCHGVHHKSMTISVDYKKEWNLFINLTTSEVRSPTIDECTDREFPDLPHIVAGQRMFLNHKRASLIYWFTDRQRKIRPTPFKKEGN